MALTQGIFARMIADSAPEEQRATSFGAFFFVSAAFPALLASLGAGLLWDRGGPSATFLAGAVAAADRAGDAKSAYRRARSLFLERPHPVGDFGFGDRNWL